MHVLRGGGTPVLVQAGGRTNSHCTQGQVAQTMTVSSDTFPCPLHPSPSPPSDSDLHWGGPMGGGELSVRGLPADFANQDPGAQLTLLG